MPRTAEELQTIRISVDGSLQQREFDLTEDQIFINGYVDVFQNPTTGEKDTWFVKRPGTSLTYDFNSKGYSGNARGCFYWETPYGTGDLYVAIGTSILRWNNATPVLLATTTTSAGRVSFETNSPSAGTHYLCVNDGAKLYCIQTNNTVTTITTNFPANNADLVYMDGCLFTSTPNGQIFHSNFEDPTTWDPTKYITAEMYSDRLVGIAHQNNLMAAFGPWSTEFFYDAGNASGSILAKLEQSVQMVGCNSPLTINSLENRITFVGSSRSGGYGVYTITGTSEIKKISTPMIDRMINREHQAIRNMQASSSRVGGHFFYCLTFPGYNGGGPDAPKTLVYDHETGHWFLWSFQDSGQFAFLFSTEVTNPWFGYWTIQDNTTGNCYTFGQEFKDDVGTNFTSSFVTERVDGGNNKRKFCSRFELIGDRASSTQNVSISYTDDDYMNFKGTRTLDMSNNRAKALRLGNFRRRAWKVSYTGNQAWRVKAIEMDIALGED